MMPRRMGYDLKNMEAEDENKCSILDSAEELLAELSNRDFMCLIGPPASGKTLTLLQVSPVD